MRGIGRFLQGFLRSRMGYQAWAVARLDPRLCRFDGLPDIEYADWPSSAIQQCARFFRGPPHSAAAYHAAACYTAVY